MNSGDNNSLMKNWQRSKKLMVEKYQQLLHDLGDVPEAIQMSEEGQLFRFRKLMEIGDLEGKRILDIGCGRADFYTYLRKEVGNFDYTGIDIVPELTDAAQKKYPEATILCRDILEDPLDETFDYVFISMVLNNNVPHMDAFAREILKAAFDMTSIGLGFNFVSSYVNVGNPNAINHDPVGMFDFCLKELSTNVVIAHHYERCDVAVFVYK